MNLNEGSLQEIHFHISYKVLGPYICAGHIAFKIHERSAHQIKPTSKKEIGVEINTSDKAYQLVNGILTEG